MIEKAVKPPCLRDSSLIYSKKSPIFWLEKVIVEPRAGITYGMRGGTEASSFFDLACRLWISCRKKIDVLIQV